MSPEQKSNELYPHHKNEMVSDRNDYAERERAAFLSGVQWQRENGWQPIEQYGGKYLISTDGSVKTKDGVVVNGWTNDQGYVMVRLSDPRKTYRAHRLVAEAFIPNPNNKPFVNHIDHNRSNNHVSNLEWCTQKENLTHADNHGRMQKNYWVGKRSANARLTDEIVANIKLDYLAGDVSYQTLAIKYGTNKRTVNRIVSGVYYKIHTPVELTPDITSGWLDIETAPKDGTKVLITDSDYPDNDATYVAHWSQNIGNGHWHINAYMNSYIPHPTHWQSLPPASIINK